VFGKRLGEGAISTVPFTPTFSKSLDLHPLSATDLTAIVGEINEIAHSLDSTPRCTALWRSLTSTHLFTIVNGWRIEYAIDSADESVIVLSFGR
jgi:hypothetical protein